MEGLRVGKRGMGYGWEKLERLRVVKGGKPKDGIRVKGR